MDHKVTTDYTRLLHNANVKVYVRARPCADGNEPPDDMFERKRETPKNLVIKDTERMQYANHAFSFDNIYWTHTTQATLFDTTSKSLVDFALKGINSCCFAYGQTGSGKTFSIFGETGEKAGLLPRSIEYLFEMIDRPHDHKPKDVTLVVSFLEIYCDRVRDLSRDYLKKTGRSVSYQTSSSTEWFLRQQQMNRTESASSFGSNPSKLVDEEYDYEKANFEIHEDAQGRVFVKDLSMVTVTSREEVDALVQSGLKLRATHETKMNAVSSRSHTVFTIHVFQQDRQTDEILYGQLNMVDLAGSERLKKSESDGQRLKEALHINSSLSAVGKVVMSLDPESGYNYIPYRDSKLTRLLQNSIGGNSFTILLATIHPMKEHYEECLSTLQFANRCRSVQNQPRVNHINGSVADKDRRIRKLQEELTVLRRQLEGLRSEYNQRFVRALNDLGFDAQEVTEQGEIRFADGVVMRSVFGEGMEEEEPDSTANVSSLMRHGAPMSHAQAHGMRRANELSKRDREYLHQKYANAKTNFTVVVTEARKDKEEARKSINDLRRHIQTLEDTLTQKSREYERALAAESSRHRQEIQQLLMNSSTVFQQQYASAKSSSPSMLGKKPGSDATCDCNDQAEQQLRQRVKNVERSKSDEITLIRQQYEHVLAQKSARIDALTSQMQKLELSTHQSVESLRGDCGELYAYVARLHQALETAQRGQFVPAPRNILADSNKLRHVKALLTTDSRRHLQFQSGSGGGGGLENSNSSRSFQSSVSAENGRSESAATKLTRPVSAPVRRAKYASVLRDRVRDTTGR
ncbi:hypothetical protein Poli38472_003276 [Pythium oligandrum]|uniref:Kinesin-like protein n=1 Tax=Pythium oligandrum TaxID=41045 RepID=A0A8K1C685_PYTOL|nr:hypothetical protein Poli38472_003276 [Pythium oligandrum]|eukprot:TMW57351.1 hypothetical protein Poli38472_003276 [Pythium oligandrum]